MAYIAGDVAPSGDCFICDAIGAPQDDASLVVERAPLTITLLNRFPYSSGHVMIAPLRHASDPRQLNSDEGAAVFSGAQRSLSALEAALHPGGFNVGLNLGAAAGGTVEHLHLHVVPRWTGDTNFMPALGEVKVIPEHLEATAAKLREAFRSLR
jgi:ATP adenylyltransferase